VSAATCTTSGLDPGRVAKKSTSPSGVLRYYRPGAPLQLQEDHRLQGVPPIPPATALEEGNETRVHRVDLPGVHHPLSFGGGVHPEGPDHEGIGEMIKVLVQGVLSHRDALGLQGAEEFADAE